MALQPEMIELDDPDDAGAVLEAMATFTERGRGWINIQPIIPPDAVAPARSILSQFFRRNSPDVALATWMAPAGDRPDAPQTIGLQHALGTRIVPVLHDWGLSLGDGWRRTQDAQRRGLVVAVPHGADHAEVLRWLLSVCVAATRVPTTGSWEISIHAGRPR